MEYRVRQKGSSLLCLRTLDLVKGGSPFCFSLNLIIRLCASTPLGPITSTSLVLREMMMFYFLFKKVKCIDTSNCTIIPCFPKQLKSQPFTACIQFLSFVVPLCILAWSAPPPLPSSAVVLKNRASFTFLGQNKAVMTSFGQLGIGP